MLSVVMLSVVAPTGVPIENYLQPSLIFAGSSE
jgi:hypothetical protein